MNFNIAEYAKQWNAKTEEEKDSIRAMVDQDRKEEIKELYQEMKMQRIINVFGVRYRDVSFENYELYDERQ